MLVRTLETLGQAVVDMRGTDAADPRLVLEIALVRLTRREAGTPVQALAERIERLERLDRGGGARRRPTPAPRAGRRCPGRAPTTRAGSRPSRSLSSSWRRNPTWRRSPSGRPEPAARRRATVDIDDVIVAWAEILPELPPATRAAVREAQPLAVDDDVITFGVPKAHYEVALPRFKKEADNIRAALSAKLGRRMMFKPVAHDGFDAEPVKRARATSPTDDEEMLDLAETGRRGRRGPGGRFGEPHHPELRRHRRRRSPPRLRAGP